MRPDKKFRQGFIGAPASSGRSENKYQVALLTPGVRASWSLKWGEGGSGLLGGLGGVVR